MASGECEQKSEKQNRSPVEGINVRTPYKESPAPPEINVGSPRSHTTKSRQEEHFPNIDFRGSGGQEQNKMYVATFYSYLCLVCVVGSICSSPLSFLFFICIVCVCELFVLACVSDVMLFACLLDGVACFYFSLCASIVSSLSSARIAYCITFFCRWTSFPGDGRLTIYPRVS